MDLGTIGKLLAEQIPGVVVEQQLHGSGAFGALYEVTLPGADSSETQRCVVRILPSGGGGADWQQEVLSRAHQLMAHDIPYVSRPLKSGRLSDGSIFVMRNHYPHSLMEGISNGKGIQPKRAELIAEQVLIGLAGLHEIDLPHGDLRPKNVFLSGDPHGDGHVAAWIVDSEIGGLSRWSQGHFVDVASQQYYPPEWKGSAQDPTATADVYSLGASVLELLCGTEARKAFGDATLQGKGPSVKRVCRRRPTAALHGLLASLLDIAAERPPDGERALNVLRKSRLAAARRPLWLALGIPAVALATALAFTLVRSKSVQDQLDSATVKLASGEELRGELQRSKEEAVDLKAENARLAERQKLTQLQLDQARGSRPPSSDSPEQVAHREWEKLVAASKDRSVDGRAALLKTLHEQLKNRKSGLDEKAADVVAKARTAATALIENSRQWVASDVDFKRKLTSALDSPFDTGKRGEADTRLKDLKDAESLWKEWAEDSHVKFEDLHARAGLARPAVKEILDPWLRATRRNSKWRFLPRSGNAPGADYRTERRVTVGGVVVDHSWPNVTSHVYANPAKSAIAFEWKPDEGISVTLEYPGTWYNVATWPDLATATFTGPLALWRLHRAGQVGSASSGLSFEIENCPGPPVQRRPPAPKPTQPPKQPIDPKRKPDVPKQ